MSKWEYFSRHSAQYYFTTGKDGVIGNKVVDAIAVADENGNIIHKFSSDNAITAYETLMCKNQSLKSDLFHELEPVLQDNYKDYRLNQFNKIYSANDYTNFDLINDCVYEDVKCIWNNLIGGIKS